jgi:phage baseplate assembly protein W
VTVALDPTDLGTDLAILPDLGKRWNLVSGQANVAQWCVLCLSSDLGSLAYDPAWGFNLLRQLNGTFSRTALSQLQSNVVAALMRNDRIQSCQAQIVPNAGDNSIVATIILETADGPFQLVLRVSQLSVDILNAGQIGLPSATPAPAATPTFAGPPGPAGPAGVGSIGPQGPAGPPGSSNQSFSAESVASDDSGNELVWWQFSADLSAQPSGTLTLDFTMLASSDAGTATYRVYVGGTFVTSLGVAPTGSLVATATRNGAGFVSIHLTGTFTNPTGVVPIQVTMQSSAAATACEGKTLNGMIIA